MLVHPNEDIGETRMTHQEAVHVNDSPDDSERNNFQLPDLSDRSSNFCFASVHIAPYRPSNPGDGDASSSSPNF